MKEPEVSQLVERTADFRISSSNMMDNSSRFVTFAVNHQDEWEGAAQRRKLELEKQIEKLTKQHLSLVLAVDKMKRDLVEMSSYMSTFMSSHLKTWNHLEECLLDTNSDADDFHDALDNVSYPSFDLTPNSTSDIKKRLNTNMSLTNGFVKSSTVNGSCDIISGDCIIKSRTRKRRSRIPDKPPDSANLWEIMKNCIGKDLSRIPMPVNFNEPLSFLQRLTEGLEYVELLTRAADSSSVEEALSYLSALAVSTYSTTSSRTSKPFNPLLGETFEYDRSEELGWRSFTEQVSHHPPVSAIHVEHEKWSYYFDFSMTTKFRGKYLQVLPLGLSHFEVKGTGHHYTWNKVSTTVHNIVLGKLWVDLGGEIELREHSTGARGRVRFYPYSYFSRRAPRQVAGTIYSGDERVRYDIKGNWDISVSCAEVTGDSVPGVVNGINSEDAAADYQVRWLKNTPLQGCEKVYNFTALTCSLNEPEDGVAPTDSRHRPDQRLMENQDFPAANAMKVRLEQAQRVRRGQRNKDHVTLEAKWFVKRKCAVVGDEVWRFTGEYWDCKERQEWSRCSAIFLEDE